MIPAKLRRLFFEPLFLKKAGSPLLPYWRELEKTQYLSCAELERVQWQRLQSIWQFIWQNNSFYKKRFLEHGLTEKSLKSPEDIALLPILTKNEIRAHTTEMISDGFTKDSLLHFKTGGSTGKALDIFITEECSELRNACARRHDRWTGWEPGEAIGAAWGNPKLPQTLKEKLKNYLVQPFIYLDTMAVSSKSVTDFAKQWHNVKPTLLFGHAHSLYILAQHAENADIQEIQPKGILSTSMMLLPHERALIEKVFKCKVTDRYGCEEVSLIGCECEKHDGMHMNIEHLVIEFLDDDGGKTPPGEPGNIIVTDLMNQAMPFMRYKVEDMAIPLERRCSCGRGLPLMGKIAGRVADFLIKKDGTRIAGVSLIENTLTKINGIDQLQIIQESGEEIILNVVPGKKYSHENRDELISYFTELFDNLVTIQVVLVDEIKPEKSGKFRFAICRINQ